ncbi:hypothetical protein B484DRAFT_443102 [Ochromonadaceae sp. CCMP2298]|nr:hypothetical protein B484DRAFT_443102 [Ochromonadaceae sp. CCMP2298]
MERILPWDRLLAHYGGGEGARDKVRELCEARRNQKVSDATHEMRVAGGIAGGNVCYERGLGIHSADYKSSSAFLEDRAAGGNATYERGVGVHSADYKSSSAFLEDRAAGGIAGGNVCYERGLGVFSEDFKSGPAYVEAKLARARGNGAAMITRDTERNATLFQGLATVKCANCEKTIPAGQYSQNGPLGSKNPILHRCGGLTRCVQTREEMRASLVGKSPSQVAQLGRVYNK